MLGLPFWECGVEGYRTALIIGWRKSLRGRDSGEKPGEEREREKLGFCLAAWLLVSAEGSDDLHISGLGAALGEGASGDMLGLGVPSGSR